MAGQPTTSRVGGEPDSGGYQSERELDYADAQPGGDHPQQLDASLAERGDLQRGQDGHVGTGTIGQIVLLEQTTNATVTLALGSNLATTAATGLVAANFSQLAAATYVVDTTASGFVLDLTKNTAGFTPNLGGNNGVTAATNWVLQGSGTIRATTFDLSQATSTNVSAASRCRQRDLRLERLDRRST